MRKTLLFTTVVFWAASAFAQNYDITFPANMNDVTNALTTPELTSTFTYDKASASGEKTYYFDDMEFGPAESGGVPVNVTFQVNMADVTASYTTPEVNGTFNNWCGGCAPMSDANGDDIWELVIALEPGTYEYKFAYDTWAGQETLVSGSSCTITSGTFTNRTLTVTTDQVLPVVCWGSCEDCGQSTGPYNITFSVDMSLVTESYTTPEVNGIFNNWCGGCAPMADADGDDVWELTISLATGTFEYKFAYDTWAGSENLTSGSPCTITTDGFTNRVVTVSDNATLETVCWGSCAGCAVGVDEVEAVGLITVYPNPADDHFVVSLNNNILLPATVTMINELGQIILTRQITDRKNDFDVAQLSNGIYFIQVYADGAFFTQPVVIKK